MLKIGHKEYSFFTVHVNTNCGISNNSLYCSFLSLKKEYTVVVIKSAQNNMVCTTMGNYIYYSQL